MQPMALSLTNKMQRCARRPGGRPRRPRSYPYANGGVLGPYDRHVSCVIDSTHTLSLTLQQILRDILLHIDVKHTPGARATIVLHTLRRSLTHTPLGKRGCSRMQSCFFCVSRRAAVAAKAQHGEDSCPRASSHVSACYSIVTWMVTYHAVL